MESLSPEVLLLIIPHLCQEPPILRLKPWDPRWGQMPILNIASYAVISRSWQYAVERFTMADIHTHSSDLLSFREIFSRPRRRQTLRRLEYEIDLPVFSANRVSRSERHKERDKAFKKGLIDLFDGLATWDKQGVYLAITTSSSVDLGHRPLDLDMGLWPRYRTLRDIYLSSDNAELPELSCIGSLYIPDVERYLYPSVIAWIISSLPGLESLRLKLNAPAPRKKELQEYRLALAKALDSPSLSNLKELYISFEESIPLNHSYETQAEDPVYPDGDVLNLSLRRLAETAPLESLVLTGWWPISPALFNGTAPFPYLQDLHIDAAMLTYDGRWYYTGNPDSVDPHFQFDTDEDEGSDSDPSIISEDTEAANGQGEAVLNDDEPQHLWRTEPDPQMFDALMKSMAEAMNRMPRLLGLEFRMGVYPTGDHAISFEYSATGHVPCGDRCRDTLSQWAAKWEIPDEILKLWRERLGWEGVILLQGWLAARQWSRLYLHNDS
ncbi:hypothetical protein ABOM_003579 [Aspergillus bombycis]|uniref:F-box domain-containing protein n=1 Tax=Aspergillus bombycis TaxID=109264 RepID=A0A1F8ADJ6_9EURO|nr:hypothetical protein ABOM_003579 [Aspergillus bombycis]OGM49435.1 hypothetical protein ABOM_003579 [Aspergillus bombycis]